MVKEVRGSQRHALVLAAQGKRYRPVVLSNNRIKPDQVYVDGEEERHSRTCYCIDWYENGKRIRKSIGKKNSADATARHAASDFKLAGPLRIKYAIRLRLPPLWLEPGMYSFWLKALYYGESVQSRGLSDILHLDVSDRSNGWNAVLSLIPEWFVVDTPQLEGERAAG